MNTLRLWLFGLLRVPMILFLRPRVRELSADCAAITIPLRRRSRNHLGSMYFGALTSGADMTPGILAFRHARGRRRRIDFVFRDCTSRFIKRAVGDVTFTCRDGGAVARAMDDAEASGTRRWQQAKVQVIATYPTDVGDETAARFDMVLAVRAL